MPSTKAAPSAATRGNLYTRENNITYQGQVIGTLRSKLHQGNTERQEVLTRHSEDDLEWLHRVLALVKTKR